MEISVKTLSSLRETKQSFADQTVIVLDIFRATSFIVTALALGAKCVLPTPSIAEAKRRYKLGNILAGERAAKKIPGFHLGNSPSQLKNAAVQGKEVILTTTNGTKAIAQARQAVHRLIGSFLNLSACSRQAVRLRKPITILCAGTNGEFSLEDSVAAGAIVDMCVKMQPSYCLDDFGMMARQSYSSWHMQGWSQLKQSCSGKRIQQLGLEQDLDDCLQIDRFSIVPVVTNEEVIQLN